MTITLVKIGNPELIRNETNYVAEAIVEHDKYYYRVDGVTIRIPRSQYQAVIANPKLYYFSTALKLHQRIKKERERIAQENAHAENIKRGVHGVAYRLPSRPEGLTGIFTNFGSDLPPGCPQKMPASAVSVASVEWSWGPAHGRQDHYRLSTNKARSHWILWAGYYDDEESKWTYYSYAYGPRKNVEARVAAIYLLIDGWRKEPKYDSDPGPFHGIVSEGLVTSGELKSVRDAVWGPAKVG